MEKIDTELARYKSTHAPIESAECVVRIFDPESPVLREIDNLCFDLQDWASKMYRSSEYTMGEDNSDYTQADYETACAGFSLLYAKLKYLVEGK